MELTRNHIGWIIAILGFIAIGTAVAWWDAVQPPEPYKTPEQIMTELYKRCVESDLLNAKSVSDCNNIKN